MFLQMGDRTSTYRAGTAEEAEVGTTCLSYISGLKGESVNASCCSFLMRSASTAATICAEGCPTSRELIRAPVVASNFLLLTLEVAEKGIGALRVGVEIAALRDLPGAEAAAAADLASA
jgi:hypothetical protein